MICFYNLTNGLENAPLKAQPHFIRIQSSHIEGKAWNQLFYQLSDELLFYLAIGEECCIIDGSTKPLKSALTTKGIPIILYILNKVWLHQKISCSPFSDDYLNSIYRSLKSGTKKRLKYYRKFLLTKKIRLKCFIYHTKRDGQYGWFKEKIQQQKDGLKPSF